MGDFYRSLRGSLPPQTLLYVSLGKWCNSEGEVLVFAIGPWAIRQIRKINLTPIFLLDLVRIAICSVSKISGNRDAAVFDIQESTDRRRPADVDMGMQRRAVPGSMAVAGVSRSPPLFAFEMHF